MARAESKEPSRPPQPAEHVAIIMDGNGRWATSRGWPRLVGHRRGAERVREIVRACPDLGIRWLTVYAFSTENWKRSTEEVLGLMAIFARYIEREADRLAKAGVRMRFIGDRTPLDAKLQRLMAGIEARTAPLTRLNLTVAINYGGFGRIDLGHGLCVSRGLTGWCVLLRCHQFVPSTVLVIVPSATAVTSRVPGFTCVVLRTTWPFSSRVMLHPRAMVVAGSSNRSAEVCISRR